MLFKIIAFSAGIALSAGGAATPAPSTTTASPYDPMTSQDVFFETFWGNYEGAEDKQQPWEVLADMLENNQAELNARWSVNGGDPGNLVSGVMQTLYSLDDTNGILDAMRTYGDDKYNKLMFWAWVHRLAKQMYENSMHDLMVSNQMQDQVGGAVVVDHSANRMLLNNLFRYMVSRYGDGEWHKMLRTFMNYRPFLFKALQQIQDSNGKIIPPNPAIQNIVNQYGGNGGISLPQLNDYIKNFP